MKPAFDFAASTPAPRARVFARPYRRGARDAPNRKIILGDERVARQVEGLEIVSNLDRLPVCERIDFYAAALSFKQGHGTTRERLKPFAAADPGVIAFERFGQRQDLADFATAAGIACPKEVVRIFHRKQRRLW